MFNFRTIVSGRKVCFIFLLLFVFALRTFAQPGNAKSLNGTSANPAIVSVAKFGLRGDGSNEYKGFKDMVDWINMHPGQVQVLMFEPKRKYFISQQITNPVKAPEDIAFLNVQDLVINGQGATIVFDGNFIRSKSFQRMVRIYFKFCKNLEIDNLIIDGQRNITVNDPSFTNGKTNGVRVNSHSFCIQASSKVKLVNCTSINALGDGFNVTSDYENIPRIPSRDIEIYDCRSYYSGRQGISIGNVVNINIKNSEFSYSGQGPENSPYFAPASGCDIEPNWGDSTISTVAVQENTKNIYITNCKFIANIHSQFVCGGNPKKYGNIHVDSCYFSDEDTVKGYYSKGIYSIGLKSTVSFENSTIVCKYAVISLAKFAKPDDLGNSEIIFKNNKVTFGQEQWIASSEGMKSILIENNRFIGTIMYNGSPAKKAVKTYISLKRNGDAIWKNNYVFIPPENITGDSPFAVFENWVIENPKFETGVKPGTSSKIRIIAKGGSVKENSKRPDWLILEKQD
ncbi:MAG: hypothetical protein ABI760_01200 [Ferruginibacter sp.]